MTTSLKALLEDWKETRSKTLHFLQELSEADLDKKLPRKKLNTIRLQAYELTLFQRDVVNALGTDTFAFTEAYPYVEKPTEQLIQIMANLDAQLEQKMATLTGEEVMDYYGEKHNVHRILSMLNGHEQMHIGQIIAFCYTVGIIVPEKLTHEMALEG